MSSEVGFKEYALAKMPISEGTDSRMQWFTVSKAADRSSKIRTEDSLKPD